MSNARLDVASTSAPRTSRRLWIALAVAIVTAIACLAYGYGPELGDGTERFKQWVRDLGYFGPLVFIVGYALAVVAFVPASALTLAAGAIFGVVEGTAYTFVGATLGATAAFWIARNVARKAIEQKIQGDVRFAAIDQAIAAEGRKIVFLLRLSPAFPFNLLNYALGLTKVGLTDYVIASLGMLPGTLLYVYLGSIAGSVVEAAAGSTDKGWAGYALQLVGLMATLAVTILVTRTARRALREATREPSA